MRGFNDEYGSWNTIWIRRRCDRSRLAVNVWPSKLTVPDVGLQSPTIARPSVDLPQPDSPTSPRVSPRASVRSTPSAARRIPAAQLVVDVEAVELQQRLSHLRSPARAGRRPRPPRDTGIWPRGRRRARRV